jgi:hypothetical protein
MSDLGQGIWFAAGAVVVAAVVWLIRTAFAAAVRSELRPFLEQFAAHMNAEEVGRADTNAKLDRLSHGQQEISDQFHANEVAHAAFDERLGRLEHDR